MSLDHSKLENLKGSPEGKMTARCPACAAGGGDTKGEHLVVWSDGRFGCAANPGDAEHRKEIFSLVGDKKPRETRLNLGRARRPKCRPILQRRISSDSKKAVPSVPRLQPEPKAEQFGTAGTGISNPYARGKKSTNRISDIGFQTPVPSVPRPEPTPMLPHEDFLGYVERVFPEFGATNL